MLGLPWSIPPRGIPLCVGPHLLPIGITFWFISYAVFKTRALTSSNRIIFGGASKLSTKATAPLHFQENPRRLHHRDRVGRLYKASPEQPTSRTTQARQGLPLISKLRARPPPLGLDSPLDIVWLLFWLHRQHDAVSAV
jgi:hypothetical protein